MYKNTLRKSDRDQKNEFTVNKTTSCTRQLANKRKKIEKTSEL
jgi:hypothetical protein